MGPDDKPEDERGPASADERAPGPADEPSDAQLPEGMGHPGEEQSLEPPSVPGEEHRLEDADVPTGAQDSTSGEAETGSVGPVGEPEPVPVPPRDDTYGGGVGGPREAEPRRSFLVRGLLVVGGIFLVALLLIGWNRIASSDEYCATCHEMEPAVASANRSVHADVPCLACHTQPGLMGAMRYVPTLAREAVHEFTGWDVAENVLGARSCESCHTNIAATPELAAAHTTDEGCASCHGDVAHPPFRLAGFERPVEAVSGEDPHPPLYVQTHGEDVAVGLKTCFDCHDTKFCEACHFRSTYPHPKGWIEQHGPTQIEEGVDACTLCHPVTFCAGCHGTEIPHAATWLDEHWRSLQDAPVDSCLLCHPKTDCTECHAEHTVHREQDLFT